MWIGFWTRVRFPPSPFLNLTFLRGVFFFHVAFVLQYIFKVCINRIINLDTFGWKGLLIYRHVRSDGNGSFADKLYISENKWWSDFHPCSQWQQGFFYIVEMRDELAPDANIRHRPLLLEEIDKYVTVIGDASKVSTITNAVYEGYHVALDI